MSPQTEKFSLRFLSFWPQLFVWLLASHTHG